MSVQACEHPLSEVPQLTNHHHEGTQEVAQHPWNNWGGALCPFLHGEEQKPISLLKPAHYSCCERSGE